MSKLKALSKTVRRLDEAAPLGRRADVDPFVKQGDLGFLDEYEKVQGEADRVLTVDEVDEAIRLEEAANEEARRQAHVSNPESGFEATYWQTNSPEEYAARWQNQINDDNFGAGVTLERSDLDLVGDIDELHAQIDAGYAPESDINFVNQVLEINSARNRDARFQMSVKSVLGANPRWTKRVKEWSEGSPYGDHVFVHMDRQMNPLQQGMQDQLQFAKPREMGVHSGTVAAAERATIISEEFGRGQISRVSDDIGFAAQELGMEPQELHNIAGRAINNYFLSAFTRATEGTPLMTQHEIWSELRGLLSEAFKNAGIPPANAEKIVHDLQSTPTTVATPHLFRGKNGLLLQDNGNFSPQAVARQLEDIWPSDFEEITAASSGLKEEAGPKLAKYIESKGYDHIVYINAVEDRGLPSIINWNPDLWISLYDPALTRGNPNVAAAAAAAVFMGQLGIGSAFIRDGEST